LTRRLNADREKWWRTKVLELEKSMRRQNVERVFEILNLKKKTKSKIEVIRDKDGSILKDEAKQLSRWKTYFEELLNVDAEVGEKKFGDEGLEREEEECPTKQEVQEAVASLKVFKAAGPDGIMAEVLKAGGEPVVEWIHQIIHKIWQEERVVEEWTTCTIVPLFKKGDKEVCDNYRGISLLSIPSKVLAKVLYQRIERRVEPKLHEAQCGFRKGRGCVDQLFNLKQFMSLSRQKEKPLFMCFIDLKKAYDSVNRTLLWKAVREYGVSEKVVKILNSLYDNTTARVRVNGKLSEHLSLKTGVKQGCVLSPLLFNIFMDWVMRIVMNTVGASGIEIRFSKQRKWLHVKEQELTEKTLVNTLMYADDLVLLESDFEKLKTFLVELDRELCSVGMTMNVKKTKMMVVNGKIDEPVVIRGEKIEVEDSFPYLGVNMRADQSSAGDEVGVRISKAVAVFRALYHPLWKRKQVSLETKMIIFRTAVLPVLLYGCETWVLSVKESERLEVFQMKCLRSILGITKFEHRRNDDIREETGQYAVAELVTRARLRWLGHVARMGEQRLPVQLLYGVIDGKARRGRPVGRWKDMIDADLKKRKMTSWYNSVQDRAVWRRIVNGEAGAGVRRRKNRTEKEDEGNEDEATLKCPTCGKKYMSKRGGWYDQHVARCGKSAEGKDEGSEGEAKLKCPTCGKKYKSKGGGWYAQHVASCGKEGGAGGGESKREVVAQQGAGGGKVEGGVGGAKSAREVLACTCGKVYRTESWFKKHLTTCGSGQSAKAGKELPR
jgi:uncharacterized C2H2 Zn-finger protein